MTKRSLVVIGSGGHAHVVSEAATACGFSVVELVDVSGPEGGFTSLLASLEQIDLSAAGLALGIGVNLSRQRAFETVRSNFPKSYFPPIIHSAAWVSPSATLAPGSVMLAHSSIGARSRLGAGGILNTGASLDHDTSMDEFGSLGPGARTGGNVTIGARTMIGLQAGILQGRNVGEDTVIGAQSLVIEDVPPLSVALGSPCEVVRMREQDETYY